MEKRLMGIILSLLGICGIIYAGVIFMDNASGERNITGMLFSGVLGSIFFFSGLRLVRTTKDKAT